MYYLLRRKIITQNPYYSFKKNFAVTLERLYLIMAESKVSKLNFMSFAIFHYDDNYTVQKAITLSITLIEFRLYSSHVPLRSRGKMKLITRVF